MGLKIKANTLFEQRYLIVDPDGVRYRKTAALGGLRKFRFGQIDLVLMSEDNVLAFQVGREVFSLPTKPRNRTHQAAIAALVDGVRLAAGR